MSTAPILPISLSPHICILQSQDLAGLLEASSLPPMPQILQSFTPLSQITTRTTTLTPVIHPSFALRFSDLAEIEEGCREPEEQRAERTIDWIGARIAKKSTKWMEEWEDSGAAARERDGDPTLRTPWWEELRRCVEGDRIPSRVEGWNHPVAIIVAVSTLAPNPLQALAQLHSRPPDVPHWVDSSNLRYTLIVHPSDSRLSDEEAGALFNAAKKQYGLHTFLLPLSFSRDGQRPVPVPMYPCLPLPPRESGAVTPDPGFLEAPAELEHVMLLSETDIQRIAKFVRELATMSLLPWMEKCVLEWNETFSSTRRLPSRLFTSTRRLFGSSNPSSPVAGQPPVSSSITRTHSVSGSISSGPGFANWATTFPQQRRLAEFATILGDLKLAVPVWESTQRDSKGGSEILPLLLSPTPATVLHVQHALSAITAPGAELTAAGQVRALTYAMRWATGTNPRDLLSDILGGERWLVWAAASAEEPPLALLLAHAAVLSVRRWSTRRAALLYLLAAKRLEKFGAGVKPLTMHFLRRAHHLYLQPHDKRLSPSFWDADGLEPTRVPGFDSIVPGIEYALGRLHYTTGDAVGAVKFFLSVLGASQKDGVRAADGLDVTKAAMDKNTLDDLRIAYQHLKATRGDNFDPSELKLKLPITLCDRTKTALRLPGDSVGGDTSIWEAREESWRAFWQPRGSEKFMRTSTAVVNEVFWVDLVLHNPLNVEIDLSNLTVIVQDSLESTSSISSDLILVETFAEVTLGPKETVTVPLSMRASASGIYFVKAVSYDFLSLFPSVENLSRRGRRLQDTPIQRQSKVYAPDVFLEANVKDASRRLAVTFIDDGRLILSHGEYREMRLWLSNAGSKPITDIWLLSGPEDEFCLASEEAKSEVTAPYTVSSTNSLISTPPHCLSEISLQPGEDASFSIILHADRVGDRELCFLFVYRERDTAHTFFSTRVTRSFEVESLMNVELRSQPSFLPESIFQIQASISNASNQGSHFVLTQLSAISSFWTITGLTVPTDVEVLPGQVLQVLLSVRRGESGQLSTGADVFRFVSDKVQAVLLGHSIDDTNPPAVELTCSQIGTSSHSFTDSWMRALLHLSRRNATASHVSQQHPHIPAHLYPRIFPLYHPHGLDVILHWELPSEGRSGFILIPGPALGATHGALDTTIQEVEQMKVKRIMYAETQRERSSILEAIRSCEWNAEMNPVVATVQDLAVLEHDFAAEVAESCLVPVTFTLRNFSLTHSARYTLKLAPPDRALLHGPLDLSPPIWTGRLTHRGILKPLERAMVRAELHVSRPDTYLLEGWTLEVEVSSSSAAGESSATQWQTARTYQDTSVVSHQARVTVVDIS